MGIPFRDHCSLCVAGVTLNGFNVATAEFKFVGRAGVPETMKYHLGEIIVRDEFAKGPVDVICFGRGPLGTGEYKVIISIFIPQQFFQFFNRFSALYQHFRYRPGQKYLPHTCLGFRLFQGQYSGIAPSHRGELKHDTFFPDLCQ